jgi:hypothetical protein
LCSNNPEISTPLGSECVEAHAKTSTARSSDPKLIPDAHWFAIFEDNLDHLLALHRCIVLIGQLCDDLLGLYIDYLTR